MFDAIAGLMAWFYSIWPSYGMAIVFLTLCVMIVLFPLTAKQVRSMQAMAKLQPEIKRLQTKYKNDRQKLNEEMMKFYRENKVNPLSSCLPLLLQMPIFFVLYQVIAGLSKRASNGGPKYLDQGSEMWEAIRDANFKLQSFGMDLAKRAVDSHGTFLKALPFYLLVALVVGTAYFQQRQMTRRNPQSAQNPQMVMIGRIMPAFFGFISLSIPAGVVLYFLVSNLFRIGQQSVLARLSPGDDADKEKDKKSGDGGGVIEAKEAERPKPAAKPSAGSRPKAVPRPGSGSGSGSRGGGGNGRAQGRPGGGSRSKKGKRKR